MKNKCFSCENEVQTVNNENTLENIRGLLTFCVPEVTNNTDFPFHSFQFCLKCTNVLAEFSTLKHKCLTWQANLHNVQEIERFCEVQVKEEHLEENLDETETENVVEYEIMEDRGAASTLVIVEAPSNKNKCPVCKVQLKNKYLVNRHIKTVHTTEKRFVCATCNQKFAAKVYLRAHEKTHDELRPYICQFCGKGCKSKSDLCHHEVIHADRRDYKCPATECAKAFKTSSELHKHKLIAHTARTEWKYQCDYCGRKFPMKCTLDRHVKAHTNERLFQCTFCDYKGFTNTELKRHMAKHDDVRAHKCFICAAEYKRKHTLELHLLQKHQVGMGLEHVADLPNKFKFTEKNFVCQFCGKRYTNSSRLRTHITNQHCDVDDDDDENS